MKFGISKNILHNMPYESISVTVSKDTTGTEMINNRKVLPAGTVLAGVDGSVFDDETQARLAVKATGEAVADGITLNDVDVTDRDGSVALVFRGTVYADKIVDYADTLKAQLPGIKFVK